MDQTTVSVWPVARYWQHRPVEWGDSAYLGRPKQRENKTWKHYIWKPYVCKLFSLFFHLHYMNFSTLPLGKNEAKPLSNLRLIETNLLSFPLACFHVLWSPQTCLPAPQASGMTKIKHRRSYLPPGSLGWFNFGTYQTGRFWFTVFIKIINYF